MDSQEIKSHLARTWRPFFGRFGRFLPIQELAIPHILNGENIVVISPAATGKTEAVVAPILEKTLNEDHNGLMVLYITPTRALVNDLYRRLEEPVQSLNLTIGRKTGDRPKIDPKKIPNVLLTTPESFDSLLSRLPRMFLTLKFVILDEIHLLDNTPRGDQLRILLIRLRKILQKENRQIQYCALSATIDDINLGERYFPDPRVCILKSNREIEYLLIPEKNFVNEVLNIFIEQRIKKALVFFNARSLAESFSQKFSRPPFENRVLVHHASLPRARREETERAMNQLDRAILLATSTLELGIDIGDVDGIVLFRPPYNISSLLQRIGRGNRRTSRLYAIGVYLNNWEKVLFETFFECARQGLLYEKRYQPSLSVIPQQIYSYLYQRRRIGTTLNNLFQVFSPLYPSEKIKLVFGKLLSEGIIKETKSGIYHLTDKLENKITYGKIHSNISEKSFGEYDVYDINQGSLIGRIYYLLDRFILGGRCWEKVKVLEKEKKVYARFIGEGPEFSKVFEGKGAGNYNYLLSVVLKKQFFPDLKELEFPFFYDGKKTYIFHLFGLLYGFIIAESLYEEGIDAGDIEGKVLVLNNFQMPDDKFPIPKEDSIKRVLKENIVKLEDALGSGAFFYDLPVELQIEDHFLNLNIPDFLEFLFQIKLVELKVEELKGVISALG
uniref:DEAD/DEAH box helicase n=1 Tax=candidate division WOR-3 bacterium TaxID=2052148 RepID=A0A7C4TH24_UNCW3